MYLLTSPFIVTLEINLLLKSFSKFCPFPSPLHLFSIVRKALALKLLQEAM
jgi:hypothetical protein